MSRQVLESALHILLSHRYEGDTAQRLTTEAMIQRYQAALRAA